MTTPVPSPLPSPTFASYIRNKEEKHTQTKVTKALFVAIPIFIAFGAGLHLRAMRQNQTISTQLTQTQNELAQSNQCIHALETLPRAFSTYEHFDEGYDLSKKQQKKLMKAYIKAQHETRIAFNKLQEGINQHQNTSSLKSEYEAAKKVELQAKADASVIRYQKQERDRSMEVIRENFEGISLACPIARTHQDKFTAMGQKHPPKHPIGNNFKKLFR